MTPIDFKRIDVTTVMLITNWLRERSALAARQSEIAKAEGFPVTARTRMERAEQLMEDATEIDDTFMGGRGGAGEAADRALEHKTTPAGES